MAVIILGSGITPVVGTREFEPIPGGSGGGDVSFLTGDANNYVLTSTGTGNTIQGEPNLTFTGTVLSLVGDLSMPSGNITVTGMTSAATTSIVHYNTSTGAVTYGASGGGTTNFLRADGTWAEPIGTGITVTGTPLDGQVAVWTSASDVEGTTGLSFDGTDLYVDGNIVVAGEVEFPTISSGVTEAIMNYNVTTGAMTYNTSGGGTTNFLRADGTWAAPVGDVVASGLPVDNQIAVWTNASTIEGDTNFTFDGGTLTVNSQINVQGINELTPNYGVRFPDKVHIGSDATPVAALDVTTLSGSNPTISINNAGSNFGLEINATSAATSQQNIVLDGATNTTVRGLDILHSTSGTAAANFGTGLSLSTEYDNGTNQISGAIDAIITNPVYASGDSKLSFKVNSGNSLEERLVLGSTGILQVDTIDELTPSTGVTIEGVLIEDSDVTIPTANYLNLNTGGTTNIYDNSGVMTFTDTATGPVTLGALATATGDVTKVGTPVNRQVGVWTGDGTIEGTTALSFSTISNTLTLGVSGTAPYSQLGTSAGSPSLTQYSDLGNNITSITYSNAVATTNSVTQWRYGGTYSSRTAVPTNAVIGKFSYAAYDGTSAITSGEYTFEVDGAIATGDFDSKYVWKLKEGAGSIGQMLELNVDGLEYSADHSTDQAANDRWLVDKGYVDSEVAAAGGLSASGTPVNDQLGVWVNASTLEGSANLTYSASTLDVNNAITVDTIDEHTADAGVTIETIEMLDGKLTVPAITGTGTRIATADSSGGLGSGNLSGQVTTTNSLATALDVSAITAQTAITAALVSTDELLVNDAGLLRRMDISVLETYMQNNLAFSTSGAQISGTPANNQLGVWTNSTDIEGDSGLTWDTSTNILAVGGSITLSTGATVDNIETILTDDDTHIPTSGAVIDAISTSNAWTKTGTNLSPTTSGDDILLAVSTERVLFGDVNNYIYSSGANIIEAVTNSTTAFAIGTSTITMSRNINPASAGGQYLGTDSLYWSNLKTDVVQASDGSSSNGRSLTLKGGDADGAGNSGGELIIKGGDAVAADGTSQYGGLTLSPGNPALSTQTGNIRLGHTAYGSSSINITPQGTQTNITLYMNSKAGGILYFQSTGTGPTYFGTDVYIQGDTLEISGAGTDATIQVNNATTGNSGDSLTVIAGDGSVSTNTNGGDLFLRPGQGNGTGVAGKVYIGDGSTTADLASDATEMNVLVYNTTTGEVNYRAISTWP